MHWDALEANAICSWRGKQARAQLHGGILCNCRRTACLRADESLRTNVLLYQALGSESWALKWLPNIKDATCYTGKAPSKEIHARLWPNAHFMMLLRVSPWGRKKENIHFRTLAFQVWDAQSSVNASGRSGHNRKLLYLVITTLGFIKTTTLGLTNPSLK